MLLLLRLLAATTTTSTSTTTTTTTATAITNTTTSSTTTTTAATTTAITNTNTTTTTTRSLSVCYPAVLPVRIHNTKVVPTVSLTYLSVHQSINNGVLFRPQQAGHSVLHHGGSHVASHSRQSHLQPGTHCFCDTRHQCIAS